MKRISILFSFIVVLLAAVLLTASSKKCTANLPVEKMQKNEGIAVLELFTSQGCSSCPPADELLGRYATGNNKHIIALAFHVDYWNRMGWIDSFSNAVFSQRQKDYASKFGGESVYTPQLVINGAKEMVGSETEKVANAVANALKELPETVLSISGISTSAGKVAFTYTTSPLKTTTQIYAALVQAKVFTYIRAGENKGVKLENYNVVRNLVAADGNTASGQLSLQLPAGMRASEFSIVVMSQDKVSGKVTGAFQVTL